MFWPKWLGVRGQVTLEGKWRRPGRLAVVEPAEDFRGKGLIIGLVTLHIRSYTGLR